MKLIISPAKKMNVDTDTMEIRGLPRFLDRTRLLCDWLKTMSYDQLKALWRCNDAIASLNYERLQHMELEEGLTPAVLAYEGIQYRYMAPHLFSWEQFDYLDRHLRILSGFYGVLRPFDGVTPYRLEMGARLKTEGARDLYAFWGDKLARGQMVRWMAERAVTRAEELQEFRDLGYRFLPERSHPGRYVFLKEDEV